MFTLRIPQKQVPVFRKNENAFKHELEEALHASITVEETGVIEAEAAEAIDEIVLQDIIRAIGAGFQKDEALLLLEEDTVLHLIDVTEFAKSKKDEQRLKGRVIGRNGKMKRVVERETGTSLSIAEKSIAIIGKHENLYIAKCVIEYILSGKPYSAALHYAQTPT